MFNFELVVNLREGAHHSGNWGGLLANPGIILANAIASMIDEQGRVKVAGLQPETLPEPVRQALADIDVGGGPGDPDIDANWGNPQLSLSEKKYSAGTPSTSLPSRPATRTPRCMRSQVKPMPTAISASW
nr:hypothetical protein GCM10020185_86390 [Pseudomonas brassicacearum subsp. brassicacearum]